MVACVAMRPASSGSGKLQPPVAAQSGVPEKAIFAGGCESALK